MRRNWIWRNAAGVVLALGAAGLLGGYWYVQQQKVSDLQQQIDQLPNGKDKVSLVKDRIALENTIAGSLIQAVGGIFIFVTAYVSFQNLKATQEKQVTERFTQAINQLGSDKIEIRFGGIYALERIARDSEKDHWTIMEVLASFIQEKSRLPDAEKSEGQEEQLIPRIPKDVQAALTVIGRRELGRSEPGFIDLSGINLSGINLSGINLSGARLIGADLSGANLSTADLSTADLTEANFRWADLSGAYLSGANLSGANLSTANLSGANLSTANLSRANLSTANLSEAYLSGANLSGAYLSGANLNGVRLNNARELTSEQVKAARNWEMAHYDEEFRQELGLSPTSKQES